jgi:hypothetical protein
MILNDQYSMNKFTINPDVDGTPISEYCALTPYGHEETTASACPGGDVAARRPFWGWGGSVCTPCDQWGYTNCTNTHYIFWISVHTTYCPHSQCGSTCTPNAN